jgi:nitroimidazol reductase NimA-like FMN-containing flavoprotein (pyridoxamine 5'-phosphate oxidase superfamily)
MGVIETLTTNDITRVRRHPERASYDRDLLMDILSNGFVCSVSFQVDGQPFIIPMTYYNDSEYIYIHGNPASRIVNTFRSGAPLAISVLELNGIVLAKGLASNSMNYRSAIIFGNAVELPTDEDKLSYFTEWIDRMVPGRKEKTILPNEEELRGVSAFKVKIEKFSVKVRKGGPVETRKNPEIWSGVIPASLKFSTPEFASSPEAPDYVMRFIESRNGESKKHQ